VNEIVDAQFHTWSSRNDPRYPWDPSFELRDLSDSEPVEKVIRDMDAAGVDAGILTGVAIYGTDNSYAIASAQTHPARLAVVARVDWKAPDPKWRLGELMSEPTLIGIRLTTVNDAKPWERDGAFDPMLTAAEELGVPVAVMTGSKSLVVLDDVARRHPDLRLAVDHLGLDQPPVVIPEAGAEPFRHLPDLIALAKHPNVNVKLTAVPTLSHEPYPFRDVWEPIARVVSAFGPERVMWGSDYNRVAPLHGYREAVDYLAEIDLLDDATKRTLYSGAVRSVFGWPPEGPTGSKPSDLQ
jgi:predicted TIM-barrel fold metal-dependent hydrolase